MINEHQGANLDSTSERIDWKRLGWWIFRACFYPTVIFFIPAVPMFVYGFIWALAYADGAVSLALSLIVSIVLPAILKWLYVGRHFTSAGHGEQWGEFIAYFTFIPGVYLSVAGWMCSIAIFGRKRRLTQASPGKPTAVNRGE